MVIRALEATNESQPFTENVFFYLCSPYDFESPEMIKEFFEDFITEAKKSGRIVEIPSLDGSGLFRFV